MVTITMNDKRVRKALKGVSQDLKQPRQLLNKVAKNTIQQAEDRIQKTKLNPDNRRWEAWSYQTLIQRTREGNVGKGLLYRTGSLLRSFYSVVKTKSVDIRNSQPYARYLHEGTGNMPRREILGWGKSNLKIFEKSAKEFFGRKWK